MTRRVAVVAAAVMTTLLAVLVLWQFRVVVAYVLISLALTAALRPLANRLISRSFVARAAWTLVYLLVLGLSGLLLFLTAATALDEIQKLGQTLSSQDAWRLPLWLEGSTFEHELIARLPPPSTLFEAVTGDQGQLVLPALLGVTQGVGAVVSGAIVILFLSIYWSINQVHFERLWLSLLPPVHRMQARGIWRTVEADIGNYLRGEVVLSLMAGLFLGLGFWLLGSPYPALLALTGAVACLIPLVGVALAVLPVLLVGLLTSVQLSVYTALFALVVVVGLWLWVRPRLFRRTWDNPILTVVLLIALADGLGLIGIIIAPPVSAVCQILWSRLVSRRAVPGAAVQVTDLKTRHARLWVTVGAMDETPPLVTSSMQRLARLIQKAEPVLQAGLPAQPSSPFESPQPVAAEGRPPPSP